MAKIKGSQIGAMGGAAVGTAVGGPLGTAIGGGLGTIVGGMFDDDENLAPQMPPIVDPVTGEQLATADKNTQSGLAQQQAFVNALNAQNGIQNQSNVYNQLQGIAAGTGPNPAQAMLNNATGQNVANQAALMASQRGAGANAGLIARQAANQGANIQQNAVGQGAALQAQQSQNAIGQAGQIAGQQVGQQAGAIGNYNQFAQNNQGQLLNARGQYNNAITGAQGNVNNANQMIAGRDASQTGGMLNGIGAAAGALGGTGMFGGKEAVNTGPTSTGTDAGYGIHTNAINPNAKEGDYQALAAGGEVEENGPTSFVGQHLAGYAKGGKVKALVSPGERYLSPKEVAAVAKGKKDAVKAGEKIPGKPKVKGNSYANDTVPKTLQEGGVVIPNSVMQSKDPHDAAAKFVAAVLGKQGVRSKK